MKKSRFTEEQIAYALRLAEGGTPVADVCRQIGISEATFYTWKKKYAGARRHRAAQAQDARGRERAAAAHRGRPDAGQADPAGGRTKKDLKAVKRRELAAWMQERFKVSVRRSCELALLRRSVWYAKSQARDQSALRQRIRDIAMSRPRFGYLRVLVMLKREGWAVGKKRVYRLYRLEGLQLRMKVRRRKRIACCAARSCRPPARTSTGAWTSSTTRCSTDASSASSP